MYGRSSIFNPLSVPPVRRRILCLYCHRTHLKADMTNGVCP